MILSMLLGLSALAADTPQNYVLRTAENVWDVAVEDINGNGLKDIFVLTCDDKSYPLKKQVDVFLASPEGGYAEQPSFSLPLDPSISTLFFAEYDGTAPRELVAADAEGATVYQYTGAQFAELSRPRFTSLLPNGSKEPIFLENAAKDLTGDGREEWLIPMPTGYQIRRGDEVLTTVACDVVSTLRRSESTSISHRLPAYHTFEHEGMQALAFLSDEFADFNYGPNWSQHRRFQIPQDLDEKWEASASMKDISGNGLPDLLVTQTRGTVRMEALTQIYLATEPFVYPDEPSATFSSQGAIASPGLVDINGNGKQDLVIINVSFGVRNIVNFFMRGRLAINAEVYLFEDGGFGSTPAYRTTLSLEAPEGRERVAYALGDFDGDGRKDVAFGEGSNSLVIKRGEEDRFVEQRAWATISVPSFGTARTHDLNANGADDIVLFHPAGEHQKRVEVILF